MEVLLGLAVALSLGVSDVTGGMAGRRLGPLRATTGVHLTGAVLIGIYLLATMQPLGGARELLLSAAAGLILAFSALCFYAGLSWGRVAVMSPVSFAAIAVLTFTVGLLRGERPSGLALAGAALIIPAVVLVARPARTPRPSDRADSERRVGLAGEVTLSLCAGGGFVGFQIMLLEIGVDGGPAPLLVVRGVGGFLGLAALAALRRRSPAATARPPRRRAVLAVVSAGTLMIVSHALLIEALNKGFLSVVGPITSLTPAFTVLGARIFLREQVSRVQAAGMVVIIVGLVVLALG